MKLSLCKVKAISLAMAVLSVSFRMHALGILSGPSFTRAVNAPLAGQLQLATDEDTRVSVSVNDGVERVGAPVL